MNDSNYVDGMSSTKEREEFTNRLSSILKSRGYSTSPSIVCRNFNVRYRGEPVTVHAVRKWLMAEAIPTQDKIQVISSWLNVKPEWLRFGSESGNDSSPFNDSGIDPEDLKILSYLKTLDNRDKAVIKEVIQSMSRQR